MPPKRIFSWIYFFPACFVGLALGCAKIPDSPKVLATTTMVADLVRHLLPPEISVGVLMGPGIDPHTYEPTARTVSKLRQSSLIIGHGMHLEGRLTELLEGSQGTGIHQVYLVTTPLVHSHSARLRRADHGWDPHVWFDPILWKLTLSPLSVVLADCFPDYAKDIESNCISYAKELGQLHLEMQAGFMTIPELRRVLITSHDAFAYLGAAYGLEVYSIQGISTAAEVSESSLRELADLAANRRVGVGFLETTVSPSTLNKLCSLIRARSKPEFPLDFKLGGELYSDSLGAPSSGAETYLGMMRHNLKIIQGALMP